MFCQFIHEHKYKHAVPLISFLSSPIIGNLIHCLHGCPGEIFRSENGPPFELIQIVSFEMIL